MGNKNVQCRLKHTKVTNSARIDRNELLAKFGASSLLVSPLFGIFADMPNSKWPVDLSCFQSYDK